SRLKSCLTLWRVILIKIHKLKFLKLVIIIPKEWIMIHRIIILDLLHLLGQKGKVQKAIKDLEVHLDLEKGLITFFQRLKLLLFLQELIPEKFFLKGKQD